MAIKEGINQNTGEDYETFVEKFKEKHTTDDCFTPDNIYNAVVDWVVKEYCIDREQIVRPFWPGGDYENFEYKDGAVVVDNPPFSMLAKINRFYIENNIRFFLFAPGLTCYNSVTVTPATIIHTGVSITYDNGAKVSTSFITNLEEPGLKLRSAPELYQMIKEQDDINCKERRKTKSKERLKYTYPPYVVSAAMMNQLAKRGVELKIYSDDCHFTLGLDSQKEKKKTIFGGGFLLSEKAAAEKAAAEKAAAEKAAAEKAAAEKAAAEKAAAEKAAAEKAAAEKAAAEKAAAIMWELSEREKEIIKNLGS